MTFERFRSELREALRAIPENLVALDSVRSTNRTGRRILRRLPPEISPVPRTFLLAREQTAGRGRLGRPWASRPGRGLYCSLLEPVDGIGRAQLMPLSVAVALCGAVREAGVPACRLKWPNDLIVGRRKLGGILIEVVAQRDGKGATAIVGFGINLGALDGEREAVGATTLEREGAAGVTAGQLLALAATRLRRRAFEGSAVAELAAEYRELLSHEVGDELKWRQGEVTVRGRYAGVDDEGHLLLDTAEGRRAVAVGDIIES